MTQTQPFPASCDSVGNQLVPPPFISQIVVEPPSWERRREAEGYAGTVLVCVRALQTLGTPRKGAGVGAGAVVGSPRPAGWCLGIPTWTPAARRLWDKKPSKCTCSLFLCERRSQGCNICVPCPRRNSDFLKPAKCPESAGFTR